MSLIIIFGSMKSGKTGELVKLLTIEYDTGSSVLYINSSKDTRTEGYFSTHSSTHKTSDIKFDKLKTLTLSEINPDRLVEVIGIDEGQFVDDLYDQVIQWVNVDKKTVYVASLHADKNGKPFGQVLSLIPHCNEIRFLKSRCQRCKTFDKINVDATYTLCLVNNDQLISIDDQIYEPACRKHWLENNLQMKGNINMKTSLDNFSF